MKKVPSSVRDVAAVAAVVAAAAVAAAAAAAADGRQRLLRDPSGKVPGASNKFIRQHEISPSLENNNCQIPEPLPRDRGGRLRRRL